MKARKVQESWIAKAPPHVREIWDFIIMKANYKDCGEIKRGQLLTTYSEIQEGLAWFVGYRKESYKKHHCEIAMKALTRERMIATTKTTRGMVITVLNYDKYQDPKNYERYGENDNETTTKLQPTDTIRKEVVRREEEKKKDIVGLRAATAREAIDILNELAGTGFKHTKTNIGHVLARLAEGFTLDNVRAVVTSRVALWGDDPSMRQYLRPQTVFGSKFDAYLQAASMPSPGNGKGNDRSCATCQYCDNPLCQRKTDEERKSCTGWRAR